jgi:PDZ domain-containing protein
VTVTIKTDDIGGSSAGLMFSLGIYQGITETDLTGGHRVAGTGTLTIEGKVGGVSGVRMKVFGAEAAGAELFLVPTENLAEAQAASTKVRVEAVATFDDALRVVRTFAAG